MTDALQPRRSLDTAAAADYLGTPTTTLVYWRAQARGPRWYKLGKHVRYDLADLDAFVEQQKAPGGRIMTDHRLATYEGLDKMQAAKILMHVARQWKAEAEAQPTEQESGR